MTSDELRREIERCTCEIENAIAAQHIAKEDGDAEGLDAALLWELDWCIAKLDHEEELELAITRETVERRAA